MVFSHKGKQENTYICSLRSLSDPVSLCCGMITDVKRCHGERHRPTDEGPGEAESGRAGDPGQLSEPRRKHADDSRASHERGHAENPGEFSSLIETLCDLLLSS